MLIGNCEETLKMSAWETVYGNFRIFYLGDFDYNERLILECCSFLESLWRGNVPFILRGVREPFVGAEQWYDGLYFSKLEDWNESDSCYLDLYIFNDRAYQELGSEISNFEWLDDLDYHLLHKNLNFYVGQVSCSLPCTVNDEIG